MDYREIKTSPEMDESLKQNLKLRGDNISLYALKRIEELENNKCTQGYACALAQLLSLEGINNSTSDEIFKGGIGSIQKAIESKVHYDDLKELKKYYK